MIVVVTEDLDTMQPKSRVASDGSRVNRLPILARVAGSLAIQELVNFKPSRCSA